MAWGKKTPKEKAETFDAQFKHSRRQSEIKKRAGKHPYDTDAKVGRKKKGK